MSPLHKVIKLLTPKEKRRLALISGAFCVMALLQVLGVGSIGPFMSVAAEPQSIESSRYLSAVYEALGFESTEGFLLFLGGVVLVLVVGGNAFTTFSLYHGYRFVGMLRYTLGLRLFRRYLYQPYTYFLDHNTSELSKNLLTEVDQLINGMLFPAMEAFAKGLSALAIMAFLLAVNPWVGLAAAVVLGAAYGLIYGVLRPHIGRLGKKLRSSNRLRFKAAGEAFGAIKDVKILGKEPAFEAAYGHAAERFAQTQASNMIVSKLPKYILEAVAFGLIVVLVIVLIAMEGAFATVVPLLSVYAFAGYRLMPSLQVVFQGVAKARFFTHVADSLYRDLTETPEPRPELLAKRGQSGRDVTGGATQTGVEPQDTRSHGAGTAAAATESAVGDRLPFEQSLRIDGLSFHYPASSRLVLRDIGLKIERNTTVGLVGPTGCGKTTLVDIILGLLKPTEGRLLADDTVLTDELMPRWQRNFGYVPQQIFLSDDTIAANIAFGVPEKVVDRGAVERAARAANLETFVGEELPDGYDTVVGERGIRLSGGQRQRVGIARALYHDPDILVMDEATSALERVGTF